ncbi:hypothetical protein PGB90_010382 [Kerria lacca]
MFKYNKNVPKLTANKYKSNTMIIRKIKQPSNMVKKENDELSKSASNVIKNGFVVRTVKNKMRKKYKPLSQRTRVIGIHRNSENNFIDGNDADNKQNTENEAALPLNHNFNAESTMPWYVTTPMTHVLHPVIDTNIASYDYWNFDNTTISNKQPHGFIDDTGHPEEYYLSSDGNENKIVYEGNHDDWIVMPHGEECRQCDSEDESNSVFDDDKNSELQESENNLANNVGIFDSDMCEILLTTIALMAFGTYFVNMMMKMSETNLPTNFSFVTLAILPCTRTDKNR